MTDQVGFTSMAGARAEGDAPEIGIGMLGYAFMGKAHSNAYLKLPYMMYPPVAIPRLVAVCGRNEDAAREAARRFGYKGYYTDWHKMLENPEVQLFDNGAPNDAHAEPTIAAAEAGKHVFCEKPLCMNLNEATTLVKTARKLNVPFCVAHTYVGHWTSRLSRYIVRSGLIGDVRWVDSYYIQGWLATKLESTGQQQASWRVDPKRAGGSGCPVSNTMSTIPSASPAMSHV